MLKKGYRTWKNIFKNQLNTDESLIRMQSVCTGVHPIQGACRRSS